MFSRIKGTQDILDLTLFNFIVDKTKDHLNVYHFTQIEVPILESLELFHRSLGETTDVVNKEMFTIKSHSQESDEGICLRPEATASIVRAFVENNVQQSPWRVFTVGSMFRYERPQKGRYRQFNQISMEVIGSQSVMEDAQFITMLDRLFHERMGINNYALIINYLGCSHDRTAYEAKLKNFLNAVDVSQLCALCIKRKDKNILRIFDCKNEQCQTIYKDAPHITDCLCATCAHEWHELQNTLELLSISFTHKPTLVRGLDYYNKTVFEFVSGALGAQNAFCAGGRYDQLVKQVGAKEDKPSIGAALGIERLMLILEPLKETLQLPQLPALHVIIPVSPPQQSVALLLADTLHAHNLVTEVLLEGSMKSMMRHANKLAATYCLIIGDDEQQKHEVIIKNMVSGTEERVAQVDVVQHLLK
jgi:histidyl-tRNA synthetase